MNIRKTLQEIIFSFIALTLVEKAVIHFLLVISDYVKSTQRNKQQITSKTDYVNPIQDGKRRKEGREQKGLVYKFFPCNFSKWKNSPLLYLTFSFNPFSILLQNFKTIPSATSMLKITSQKQKTKKRFSWSNLYKFEVTITSPIKILKLPDFDQMNTSTS